MKKSRVLLLASCLALSGCGAFLKQYESSNSFQVAAESIDESVVRNVDRNDHLGAVGLLVNDSVQKCGKFVNGLVLAETGVNSSLDILTTVFTALGTAFTPISTVHALTAAGAISSGSKTAINSDLYAKATISNYAEAIDSSYFLAVNNYVNQLSVAKNADVTVSIELAKLRIIHKACSLASAQSTISSTLRSPSGPEAQASVTDRFTLAGSVAPGDQITLTARSSAFPDGIVKLPTLVAVRADTLASVASQLRARILANAVLTRAEVGASLETSSDNSQNVLVLSHPASLSIAWTIGSTGHLTAIATPHGTAPASPSATPVVAVPAPVGPPVESANPIGQFTPASGAGVPTRSTPPGAPIR